MTQAGLGFLAVLGGIAGLALHSAALLILALIALMLALWLDAHHPRRWKQQ